MSLQKTEVGTTKLQAEKLGRRAPLEESMENLADGWTWAFQEEWGDGIVKHKIKQKSPVSVTKMTE